MSSVSRKRRRSKSFSPTSPSSEAAANTSRRSASVKPVTTTTPTIITVKPTSSAARPAWRSGGGSGTTATPRGRPPTRGSTGRLADRSRSSTPNQLPVSTSGRTRPDPREGPCIPGQSQSGRAGQRDAHPHASATHQPIAVAPASAPRVNSRPQPAVATAAVSDEHPLVVNQNNSVNYAPGGSIVNQYRNETYVSMSDSSSDALQIIEKGLGRHHVPKALYDAQSSEAGCMEGTRVQLLESTKRLLETRGGAHIVWIAGMAGTGKTSIAVTVCQLLATEPTVLLGGTFFCSRSAGTVERTDAQCIIPTFAVILARVVPAYAKTLAKELQDDPDLAHKSMRVQVERLLAKPLADLDSLDRQIVLVIDALDECSDEAKLAELINALAGFTSSSPIKFLLTSRPEMHIRDTLITDTSLSTIVQLHNIDLAQVTADIRLYIQKMFEKAPVSSTWYAEHEIDDLATLSSGLFIFASTAVAYILKRKDTPGRLERLRIVKQQTSSSTVATSSLDKMYSLILAQASDPDAIEPTELDETRRIVAVILSARAPLTLKGLAEVLGLTPDHLRGALYGLHAVIFVPDEDDRGEPRALHASFGDFIFTRAPEHIRISKQLGHHELARGCLERMNSDDLCFNVSRTATSHKRNYKAKAHWIANSLMYACLHWAHHVDLASRKPSFDTQIVCVLRRKLLFWLELLSIIGEAGRAFGLLRIAASTATMEDVVLFLCDALAFVISSYNAIQHHASHIYLSALPFAPKDSLISRNFSSMFTGLPSVETVGIDRHGGRCVMILGHEHVGVIAISPDGKFIASGSTRGTIMLWDARSGTKIRELSPNINPGSVHSMTFTLDSDHLVAGTIARVFRWDIHTGRLQTSDHFQDLYGYDGRRHGTALSPDGGKFACQQKDREVVVWSTSSHQRVCNLSNADKIQFSALSFSSDGKTLASGDDDGIIRLWDQLGQPVGQSLEGCQTSIHCLAFSQDGLLLAAGIHDGTVSVWDVRTGHYVCTCSGHRGLVTSVAFAPNTRVLASASWDRTVRIWTLRDDGHETASLVLRGHSDRVTAVCFSNDGLNVISCSNDGSVRVWDVGGSYPLVPPLDAHTSSVNVVAMSGNGLIASASSDGSIRVWNAQTCAQMYPPLLDQAGSNCCVAFSLDSCRIVTGSADAIVRLWDSQTGRQVQPELRGHSKGVTCVACSPGGSHVASGSDDCTIRIWDVSIGRSAQILQIECGYKVYCVAYSPDGKFIAGSESGRSKNIRIFDAAAGQHVRSVSVECDDASMWVRGVTVAFSSDGARIMATSCASVVGFDIQTGAKVFDTQQRSDISVTAVACSPDGQIIASGRDYGTVRFWDAKTATVVGPDLHGHERAIYSVVFSPDGRFLVTGGNDKTIRVWDLEKVRLLASQCGRNALASLAFARYSWEPGCLVSPTNDYLLWVPLESRYCLEIAGICKIISTHRTIITAHEGLLHQGEHWTRCWLPDSSSSS